MAERLSRLRRRDFLLAGVAGLGGLAAIKVGGRLLWGAAVPEVSYPADRLVHLSRRQEAVLVAVALAMVGPSAEQAYLSGAWDPAAHVDKTFDKLAPDQRLAFGMGIHLLEEWTWGLTGFSGRTREQQVAFLASWRTSSLALHRTIWGVLHSATSSSFAAVEAGSRGLMGHPGPCVGTGRAPGQTARFTWDEGVP